LILGGARSGKSRHAEQQAREAEAGGARVVVLATALPGDDEMRERIAAHRSCRPAHWETVEVPLHAEALAVALAEHARRDTCVLVDCLTLWFSQLVCPPGHAPAQDTEAETRALMHALATAQGQVLLVSNEIGWGVVPLGREARAAVDGLGWLNQEVARDAQRVTLMVAGLPVEVKSPDR
jgi:adenosylcobinamide kinase/adenosylcobinamide-phosphate guanylyltransferase